MNGFLRPPIVGSGDLSEEYEEEGEDVWIRDEKEGFVLATPTGIERDHGKIQVETLKGTEDVKQSETWKVNPSVLELCEDMASLSYLNEASILYNLKQRYKYNLIHTYSGMFCLSINPWKMLPIYSKQVVSMYKGQKIEDMPPHVYAVAENAYNDMLQGQLNQSILITGESGAGKTENTKKMMQYFAWIGNTAPESTMNQSKNGGPDNPDGSLEEQIMQSNPILEAFANAKTVHNDNSSRFGKFTKIYFDGRGRVAGAEMESYLLEKSRVISQSSEERSFHIFYQLLSKETSAELKSLLKLDPKATSDDYRFTENSLLEVDTIDDAQDMQNTQRALAVLGLSMAERLSLLQAVSAVLNLGQVSVGQSSKGDQAYIKDMGKPNDVCELLGLKPSPFVDAVTEPKVRVGDELVRQSRNAKQVSFTIGALAKALYEKVFQWLVARCNQSLTKRTKGVKKFIGVLDIAGFEIFPFNSFEQLCINYTNEKLQQFFNHRMFVLEQEEYRKEGIAWNTCDFGLDLQPTIDLIEKPMGLLSLLEEECMVPKGSEKQFVEKMDHQFLKKDVIFGYSTKNPIYGKPKLSMLSAANGHFSIAHYAGTVNYNVDGWLDKNKDPLNQCLVNLFQSSEQEIMRDMWSDHIAIDCAKQKAKNGRRQSLAFQTVTSTYRGQLTALLQLLNSTSAHFVRCLVPNRDRLPGVIDSSLLLHQLRCNGVLEGIRIARQGYPNRLDYAYCVNRYRILDPRESDWYAEPIHVTERLCIVSRLNEDCDYQLGHTKLFVRSGVLGKLESLRSNKITDAIAGMQALTRSWIERVEVSKMAKKIAAEKVIQRNVHHWVSFKTWNWFKMLGRVRVTLRQLKYDAIEELKNVGKVMEGLEKDLDSERRAGKKLMNEIEMLNLVIQDENRKREMDLIQFKDQLNEKDREAGQILKEMKQAENIAKNMENELFSEKLVTKNLRTKVSDLEKNLSMMNDTLTKERRLRLEWEERINNHEDEIQRLLKQLQQLQEEKTEAEVQLTKKILELESSKLKMEELRDKIIKLEAQEKIMQNTIDEMNVKLSDEKMVKRRMESENKELRDDLHDYANRYNQIEKLLDQQTKYSREKEAEVMRLQRKLQEASSKHDQAIQELKKIHSTTTKQLQEQLETLHRKSIRLESQNQQLQAQLDSTNEHSWKDATMGFKYQMGRRRSSSITSDNYKLQMESVMSRSYTPLRSRSSSDFLSRRLEEMESENRRLQSDKRLQSREIDVCKRQLQEESAEKELLSKQCKTLRLENNDLGRKLGTREGNQEDIKRQLQKALNDYQNIKTTSEQKLVEKDSELELLKRRLENRIRDLEEENLKKGNGHQLIAVIEAEKDELQELLKDAQAELRRGNNEIESLHKIQRSQEQALNVWADSYKKQSQEVESSRLETNALKDQLRKAQKTIDSQITGFLNGEKTREELEEEVNSAQSELRTLRLRLVGLDRIQSEFNTLQGENSGLYEQIDRLHGQIEHVKAGNREKEIEKERECQKLRSERVELVQSLTELRTTLRSMEREEVGQIEHFNDLLSSQHEREILEAENLEFKRQVRQLEIALTSTKRQLELYNNSGSADNNNSSSVSDDLLNGLPLSAIINNKNNNNNSGASHPSSSFLQRRGSTENKDLDNVLDLDLIPGHRREPKSVDDAVVVDDGDDVDVINGLHTVLKPKMSITESGYGDDLALTGSDPPDPEDQDINEDDEWVLCPDDPVSTARMSSDVHDVLENNHNHISFEHLHNRNISSSSSASGSGNGGKQQQQNRHQHQLLPSQKEYLHNSNSSNNHHTQHDLDHSRNRVIDIDVQQQLQQKEDQEEEQQQQRREEDHNLVTYISQEDHYDGQKEIRLCSASSSTGEGEHNEEDEFDDDARQHEKEKEDLKINVSFMNDSGYSSA